jgi:hypothetical protein
VDLGSGTTLGTVEVRKVCGMGNAGTLNSQPTTRRPCSMRAWLVSGGHLPEHRQRRAVHSRVPGVTVVFCAQALNAICAGRPGASSQALHPLLLAGDTCEPVRGERLRLHQMLARDDSPLCIDSARTVPSRASASSTTSSCAVNVSHCSGNDASMLPPVDFSLSPARSIATSDSCERPEPAPEPEPIAGTPATHADDKARRQKRATTCDKSRTCAPWSMHGPEPPVHACLHPEVQLINCMPCTATVKLARLHMCA